MTTGELIKMLQEADPDGSTPVCVANHDVYFVQRLPAYYDGSLQQLVHDESLRGKAWSIIGAKYTRHGDKVDIVTMSIQDVMVDMPELPVEVTPGYYADQVEVWRAEAREE